MDIYTFFLQHDLVVQIIIIAFFISSVIILEKSYIFIMLTLSMQKFYSCKSLEDVEQLPNTYIKILLQDIASFKTDNQELFNAYVGVTLDKYESYLMRYISVLGLVAILSPMIGLIGTFLGVWHVFDGISSISLSDPSVIAKGIKEVLIDTMAGLSMAVFAMVFYKGFELYIHTSVIHFEEQLYKVLQGSTGEKK